MRRITWQDRLRYEFDNWMSRGTLAIIGALAVLLLLVITVAALVIQFTGENVDASGTRMSLPELLWQAFLHAEDTGTITTDRGGLVYTAVMLSVTIGGILVFSALIGVLATGLQRKIDDLRKGRSFVVEQGHTLILGWSPIIFTILEQLVLANEHKLRACVVILAEMDKVEMEDAIRVQVPKLGRTRVVCRSGKPNNMHDLAIVNPRQAHSMIVLSPTGPDPDAYVLKILLAIIHDPQRRRAPYHIVAQLQEPDSITYAQMIGKNEIVPARLGDALWMLTAQAVRHSRLSVVFSSLLDFRGDEIYFHAEPTLTGESFGKALFAHRTSNVIGIRTADRTLLLAPPMDTLLGPNDALIVIAENASAIQIDKAPVSIDTNAIRTPPARTPMMAKLLILGWNADAGRILRQLDEMSAPGGLIRIVAQHPALETELGEYDLRNVTPEFQNADPRASETLAALNLPGFDRVIVLSDTNAADAQSADAQSLIILLQLRALRQAAPKKFGIVTQMMVSENRELANVIQVDDIIVSDEILSYLLVQVSQEKDRLGVLSELVSPQGKELYLKLVSDYIVPQRATNFYTVIQAAKCAGHIAIGYCVDAEKTDAQKMYGVHVNPPKDAMVRWGELDRLIILAER